MSKFSQALNKIQQAQSGRASSLRDSGGDSVFINAVDGKIRSRQARERKATLFSILQPLAIVFVIAALVVIFFVGVNQGMKIKQEMHEEQSGKAAVTGLDEAAKAPQVSEPAVSDEKASSGATTGLPEMNAADPQPVIAEPK